MAIVVGVMMFLYKDKKSQASSAYGFGEMLLVGSLDSWFYWFFRSFLLL